MGSLAPTSLLPCTLVLLSLAPTGTPGMCTAHRLAFQGDAQAAHCPSLSFCSR